MTSTYEKIATSTISGTSTSTVTFSSISGSYTDMRLIISAKTNSGSADTLLVAVNTSSSISRSYLIGNGSTATSGRQGAGEPGLYVDNIPISSSSSYNATTMDFFNYSNATTYKTVLSRLNNAEASVRLTAYLIPSTSAITSITLTMASTANLGNGSTFTLYGIKAE